MNAKKALSLLLSMVLIMGVISPFSLVSASKAKMTVTPTALFDTKTLSVDGKGTLKAESATIATSDSPSYYRCKVSSDGSSADGTRVYVSFSEEVYPENFTLLENHYMKIGYRSNIASSSGIDLNPHPGVGNRLWSASCNMTYDSAWHDIVIDLSAYKWSGGEQTTSSPVQYPATGSSDTVYTLNFDGVMKALTIKPYKTTGLAMKTNEYFDISYVAFFDNASDANDYVYTYDVPTPAIGELKIASEPIENFSLVIGDDVPYNEKDSVNDLADFIYKRSFTKISVNDDNTDAAHKIIFGGDDDKSKALAATVEDGEFKIAVVDGDLIIVSNVEYGYMVATNYIVEKFLGGANDDFTAASVNINFETPYVGDTSDYVTYNTENVNSLEYIKTAPDAAEIGTMKVDGMISPLGMDDKTPKLEWYISSPERGEAQSSFRIVMAKSSEDLNAGVYTYDSGVINSSDTSFTLPESAGLEAESEYFWQIITNLTVSGEVKSNIESFETGVMNTNLSGAKWIASGTNASTYNTSTTGKVVVDMKLNKSEAGIAFGSDINQNEYYMWQINAGSSYESVVLRPHYKSGAGWSVLDTVSLADVFENKSDAYEDFTMTIDIAEGVIKTYINDTLVNTITKTAFEIGCVMERPGYEGYATINSLKSFDKDGKLVYSSETETAKPMYRRDFTTSGNVVKARLYASALGFYNVEINGERVNDSYLNPGQTSYEDKIYYQTYDVTEYIRENNAISATVGDGFYKFRNLGKYSAFIARLVITYDDGSEYVLMTDDTWQSYEYGPVLTSSIYYGEKYDARRAVDNASTYGACADWSGVTAFTTLSGSIIPAEIVAEEMEPVRNVISFTPVSVKKVFDTTYVYDFGQNIAGTVKITASAAEGTEITLTYGEYVDASGLPITSYMLGHNGPDKYIFAGDESETYSPDLVYHGFRYLQIDGLDHALDISDVHALVLTNDMRQTSYFESSNAILNRYWHNTVWSQRGNFVSNLTDCPTREKNGWTGDAQIFVKAGSFNMDVRNVYENYMSMMRSSMSADGAVPEILPVANGTSNSTKTPSGWSDAVVTIPYELYMQYGDTDILNDNYDSMKAWISFLLKYNINDEEDDYVRYVGWYGDHLAYGDYKTGIGYFEEQANEWRQTKFAEVGTAYTAYSCSLIAEVAEILGNDEDAAYYTELFEKFADAWRKNFLDEDGITSLASTQTSYVMGIYYDLYETPEKKAAAVEKLCEQIEADGGHQTVGFIGMPDLLNALSENGKVDVAYSLLLNTDSPSLLYPVTQGATTTWEGYSGGSHNHYVQSTPIKWAFTDVLGIDHRRDHDNAGYKTFTLEPKIGYGLTHASGAYESANGIIRSAWELTNTGYKYTCTVPANTSATLTLTKDSASSTILESGKSLADAVGISNVTTNSDSVVMTLTSGTYEFEVGSGTIKYGDVDGDGSVTSIDGIKLQRYLGSWYDSDTTIDLKAADCNASGSVEPVDGIILQRHLGRWNEYLTLPYTTK